MFFFPSSSPSNWCVTTYGIVLVTKPDHEDDIEGSCCVLKELRHDCLHPDQGKDDSEQGGSREGYVCVELQHLQGYWY